MFVLAVLEARPLRLAVCAKYLHHQHTVMRRNCATAFAHDIRMRHRFRVAHLPDGLHQIIRVLPQRIIGRAFERRTASVVIHRQTATDIQILHRKPFLAHLGIKPRGLLNRLAQGENIRHLRPDVGMQQTQGILPALRPQALQCGHQLRGVQAKLRILSAAVRPLAGAAAQQPQANAQLRLHPFALGHPKDLIQLIEFLDHQNHLFTQPRAGKRRANKIGVLVAIANQQGIGQFLQRQRGK